QQESKNESIDFSSLDSILTRLSETKDRVVHLVEPLQQVAPPPGTVDDSGSQSVGDTTSTSSAGEATAGTASSPTSGDTNAGGPPSTGTADSDDSQSTGDTNAATTDASAGEISEEA
ncbi:MAG: hypothetical protein WCD76_21025, partial [Pyrinomonadaceae bacterium]